MLLPLAKVLFHWLWFNLLKSTHAYWIHSMTQTSFLYRHGWHTAFLASCDSSSVTLYGTQPIRHNGSEIHCNSHSKSFILIFSTLSFNKQQSNYGGGRKQPTSTPRQKIIMSLLSLSLLFTQEINPSSLLALGVMGNMLKQLYSSLITYHKSFKWVYTH